MTYSKAIDNNVIFFICASRVILVINLGHDGGHFVTNLFIPPFLPQRWDKWFSLHKTSVHGGSKYVDCAFDKASFAARSASSFPVISRWLGIQQNVMNLSLDNISWHVCKTLFTRGFLLSWLSMACNKDMLSENITKLFLVETFTCVKALLIASTSAVKYCNHLSAYNPLFRKDKHMQMLLLFQL